MPRKIYRTPRARLDLIEIATAILRDQKSAAWRFLDAAEATLKILVRSPNLGVLGEFRSAHLDDIRRWRINGFENYLIFYRSVTDGIQVIRILHGAREIEAIFADEQ